VDDYNSLYCQCWKSIINGGRYWWGNCPGAWCIGAFVDPDAVSPVHPLCHDIGHDIGRAFADLVLVLVSRFRSCLQKIHGVWYCQEYETVKSMKLSRV